MAHGRHDWIPAETWLPEKDETLRLQPGRKGLEVRVLEGCLVVTQEGHREDHVLRPGDRPLLLAGPGLVVAWAQEPSQVMLSRPQPPVEEPPPLRAA